MTIEHLVPVRLYFDADWLVVASMVRVGSALRVLDHVVLERPVADVVLVAAVRSALVLEVPAEFGGGEAESWEPVLQLLEVDGLEMAACCWVSCRSGLVSVTAMKPGDDGFPVVAPRGDAAMPRLDDDLWLAYELRRALVTAVNSAGERFGPDGGLHDTAAAEGSLPMRHVVGAEPSSVVARGGAASELGFVLGAPAASAAAVSDEEFAGLLDDLAGYGLWDSIDAGDVDRSREQNLKYRSWRWGLMSPSVVVGLDLDSMREDDLDRSLVNRIRDRWAVVGLDLVVEHRSGADHADMEAQGFRVWVNGEPVSYGPTIDTIYCSMVLINWLADQAGIDHRLYLSGMFNGWDADPGDFEFEMAYFLSRPAAELIQNTPLLEGSQRLVPVEELSGFVHTWSVR